MKPSRVERDFGTVLQDFDQKPIRLSALVDQGTMQLILGALMENLKPEYHAPVTEALNKGLGKPTTLSVVCCIALSGGYEDERKLPMDKRIARFHLGNRLKARKVRITVDERDELKTCIQHRYPESLVAPQAHLLLEGLPLMTDEDGEEETNPTAEEGGTQ